MNAASVTQTISVGHPPVSASNHFPNSPGTSPERLVVTFVVTSSPQPVGVLPLFSGLWVAAWGSITVSFLFAIGRVERGPKLGLLNRHHVRQRVLFDQIQQLGAWVEPLTVRPMGREARM